MGLLLQKTNIIRDYLEDYVDGRAFWPQEVRNILKYSLISEMILNYLQFTDLWGFELPKSSGSL